MGMNQRKGDEDGEENDETGMHHIVVTVLVVLEQI
jgi:hypothetical protein